MRPWDDTEEYRPAYPQCCPMDTDPPSCTCPDGCGCTCQGCDCGQDDDEDDVAPRG